MQVLAFTDFGDGVISRVHQVTTDTSKSSPPRALSLQNIQSNALRVAWLAPEDLNAPPSSISYKLRFVYSKCINYERQIITELSIISDVFLFLVHLLSQC